MKQKEAVKIFVIRTRAKMREFASRMPKLSSANARAITPANFVTYQLQQRTKGLTVLEVTNCYCQGRILNQAKMIFAFPTHAKMREFAIWKRKSRELSSVNARMVIQANFVKVLLIVAKRLEV